MSWLTMSSVLIQVCLAIGSIRFSSANYFHGLLTDRRESSPQCTIDDVIDMISKEDLLLLLEEVAKKEDRTTAQILAELEGILGEIQQTEELKRNMQSLSMKKLLKTVGELPPFFPKIVPNIFNANSIIKIPPTRPYSRQRIPLPSKYFPPEGPRLHFRHRTNNFRKPANYAGTSPVIDRDPSYIVSPIITFRPPPGVIVQVNSESMPDQMPYVTVTVSPLMTVVEALRQADVKLQRLIETPNDIFSFKHSPLVGCYVVESVGPMQAESNGLWKVEIVDQDNKVVYDSVCLPSGREVIVKPGMKILLSYQSPVE